MTPDELEADRREHDARRAAQLLEGRAKQLVGDVGSKNGRNYRKRLADHCRKTWPRLTEEDVEATVARAIEYVDEMAAKRAMSAAERDEQEAHELDAEMEKPITGRRLDGAELEEAKMAATKEQRATAKAVRAHVLKRLRKDPELKSADLYAEAVQKFGYQGGQSAFNATVMRKARQELEAEVEATAAAPQPDAPAAAAEPSSPEPAGDTEPRVVNRVAAALANGNGAHAADERQSPVAGSGGFLVQAISALRFGEKTRVTVTLDVDGDAADAAAEVTKRLRDNAA